MYEMSDRELKEANAILDLVEAIAPLRFLEFLLARRRERLAVQSVQPRQHIPDRDPLGSESLSTTVPDVAPPGEGERL